MQRASSAFRAQFSYSLDRLQRQRADAGISLNPIATASRRSVPALLVIAKSRRERGAAAVDSLYQP